MLSGNRQEHTVTFTMLSVRLVGETATLYLRRAGQTEYSAQPSTQVVSPSGVVTFSLKEPGEVSAYVRVGDVLTNRVTVPAAPLSAPPKLTGVKAVALGGGTVRLSWKVPSWASQHQALYWYQVQGQRWKSTDASSVLVKGLAVGSKVTLLVRPVLKPPGVGGVFGSPTRVTVRVQ